MNADRKPILTLEADKIAAVTIAGISPRLFLPFVMRHGRVTYSVVAESQRRKEDRRREPRKSVHLRSGKVLAVDESFLVECAILNRTRTGARIKLARLMRLPKTVWIYDDQTRVLREARVAWQNGKEVGCRTSAAPATDKAHLRRRLEQAFYAVR